MNDGAAIAMALLLIIGMLLWYGFIAAFVVLGVMWLWGQVMG